MLSGSQKKDRATTKRYYGLFRAFSRVKSALGKARRVDIRSLFAVFSRVRPGLRSGKPAGMVPLTRHGLNNGKPAGVQRTRWPDPALAGALLPLERLVVMRYRLESLRLILLWGLAAAGVVLALSWLYPALPFGAAVLAGCVAALVIAAMRLHCRPDALAVVRTADSLALDGAAVTVFRISESGAADNWSLVAAEKGTAACIAMAGDWPSFYPAEPWWSNWRGVALLAGVVLAMQLVPNPLASYWAQRQTEREALAVVAAEAGRVVERVKDLKIREEYVLPDTVMENLAELPREIKKSSDRRQAADELERAGWDLQEARSVISTAAARDIERLTEIWGKQQEKHWRDLAAAIKRGDAEGINRAVQAFNETLPSAGEKDREKMTAALYESAGAVQDPSLRRALWDTAGAMPDGDSRAAGTPSGSADKASGMGQSGLNGPFSAEIDTLAGVLTSLAETAAAGNALGSASTSLAGLAHGLAGSGPNGAYGMAAGGNGSGSSIGSQYGGAGGTGSGGDGAVGGGSAAGGGAVLGSGGSANYSGTGDNTGSGSNPNDGDGSGSDADGGAGGRGTSGGSGTGAGGRGSGGTGAGLGGGGLEMVYTPFPPDSGGEQSRVSGRLQQGEQGSEVTLDSSPATLGALRPYNEVYGQYMAEANDSLSRAPLPPDMEQLVWQYFSVLGEAGEE
ncbi:hypothetical protein ABDB91_13835 [Desulfoscipio sp. XC116]|uniref:hypothetical protein n=1 Tax=Desulfoscipio sp. XC116 TaxID=3144975 RepID=UPI00325C0E8C